MGDIDVNFLKKKKNGFEDKNLAKFDLTDLFTDFP